MKNEIVVEQKYLLIAMLVGAAVRIGSFEHTF